MKFIPILFSTQMVQAILDGRKKQTRRKIPDKIVDIYYDYDDWASSVGTSGLGVERSFEKDYFIDRSKYKIGDILWVRENLYQHGELGLSYVAGCEWLDESIIPEMPFKNGPYGGDYSSRTVPNIHMPMWACRIFLKIKSIKVERLQDISEEDAKAEGVQSEFDTYRDYVDKSAIGDCYLPTAKCSFETLWESINGIESWESNPWVWVIEFERCEKPENF